MPNPKGMKPPRGPVGGVGTFRKHTKGFKNPQGAGRRAPRNVSRSNFNTGLPSAGRIGGHGIRSRGRGVASRRTHSHPFSPQTQQQTQHWRNNPGGQADAPHYRGYSHHHVNGNGGGALPPIPRSGRSPRKRQPSSPTRGGRY